MKKVVIIVLLICIVLFILGVILLNYFNLMPENSILGKKVYYAKDFNITVIKSTIDYNGNGIDDYTDILEGAREDARNKPKYVNAYYAGGYPPSNEGVCTDLVWRAFEKAGYSLKDMVDEHIRNNRDMYSHIETIDSNIDFRRVRNLEIYFKDTAKTLTNDPNEIEEWMPGDIVIFGEYDHIGIISDKRNKDRNTVFIA